MTKQRYKDEPEGSGPCAKQVVTATLVDVFGNHYVGTNYCMTPQTICPRGDLPSGVGYEMCKDICHQVGHAETNAIALAKKLSDFVLYDSVIYLQGHTYPCDNCQSVSRHAGVRKIVVTEPPEL